MTVAKTWREALTDEELNGLLALNDWRGWLSIALNWGIVAASFALVAVAPPQAPKARLAIAMGLLAVIPDLDVLGFRAGIAYGDVMGHRGFSHSILFALLASSAVAWTAFRSMNGPPEAGNGFQDRRIRPLCHPSGSAVYHAASRSLVDWLLLLTPLHGTV